MEPELSVCPAANLLVLAISAKTPRMRQLSFYDIISGRSEIETKTTSDALTPPLYLYP